jgi:hypothetical protein
MPENEITKPVAAPATENKQAESESASPSEVDDKRDSSGDSEAAKRDTEAAKQIAYYLPNRRDRLVTWATKWAPVVTFFNLSLILFTFLLVKITNKQADISDRQTRDNEAVQRAFVISRGTVSMTAQQAADNTITGVSLYLPWENSGTTPTENMIQHANWCAIYNSLPKGYWFPDLGVQGGEDTPLVLGPRAQLNTSPLTVNIERMRLIQSHKMRLFLWGWTTYNDIFPGSKGHRTEFCYEVTDIIGSFVVNGPVNVILTLCPEHNCTDPECAKQHESYDHSVKDPCPFK